MYLGGGAYQLPTGEIVDQTTAIAFALDTYGGTSTTYTGPNAQSLFGIISGQANITAKTVYNYTKWDGSASFQTSGYHGSTTYDNGSNTELYYYQGTSIVIMADGEDVSKIRGTTSSFSAQFTGYIGGASDFGGGFRAPDFYAVNISASYFVTFNVALEWDQRHGHLYFSPTGGGLAYPTGFVWSATANWVVQNSTPTQEEMAEYLIGNSVTWTAAYIGAIQVTYSLDAKKESIGVGFGSTGISATYNYQSSSLVH